MEKNGKRLLTPKLRFPEFRDEAGWTEVNLGDVLDEHGLRNDGACEVHSVSVHKGVINQIKHLGRSFAAADRSSYNLVKPYDIVYTKSPTGDFPYGIIKQNKTNQNVIVSPLYGVFSPSNRHLGYILDAYFESPIKTNNYLSPITQKGAKNTIQISNETFVSKGLFLPNIEKEHEKIADCLTSLDELIAAQYRKLDALKILKKGLVHQLFPCKGEILPHLRLPEFRDEPEWEQTSVEDVADVLSGSTPSKENQDFWNGSIPWVSAKDMKQFFLDDSEDHISWAAVDDGARLMPADTLLILTRGMTLLKDVPICVLRRDMSFNQDVKALQPKDGVDGLFLAYLLLGYKKRLLRMVDIAGHGTGKLNTDDLKAFELVTPKPAEQQQIAFHLTSLEDLIAAQTQKLAALKLHKKALMQQLFPSPEEGGA